MPTVTYPLDLTGLAASNLIADEVHVLTEINDDTYRIIIPEFAPFYLHNFTIKHVSSAGVTTVLVPDVDYYLCLPYIGATRSIGMFVYGGITINTELLNGIVKITYQTLGGEWTADANYVLNRLAEMVYNPRITVWDIVTNKPTAFPPTVHDQSLDYVYGHQDLIDAINRVSNEIATVRPQPTGLLAHLLDDNNPHMLTKEQIGLGSVQNIPMASDTEVAARSSVNKLVTLAQVLTITPETPDTPPPPAPVVQKILTASSYYFYRN
jgi:hypothetical protein